MEYKFLSSLDLPSELKNLTYNEKYDLCCEIRTKIIETVSKNGGHLASNLGAVELTLALHSVFNSPEDKIVFDVGHQSYAHKLLTGRFDKFNTLRQNGGLSGFTRPSESEHDPAVSGHSSNSISVALGLAQAMKLKGDSHHAIAVIGDGALTGGLAYEGLNNAGRSGANIIVVLNYNEMSISKNVGGIAKYLSELRTKDSYKKTKSLTKRFLDAIPFVGDSIKRTISASKEGLKEELLHCTIFEDLGFDFIGPINGHNVEELEAAFVSAQKINGPVLVQVNTVKGYGYMPAEVQPGEYHGVPSFNIETGEKPAVDETFADHFGKTLAEMARKDDRICAITAAMKYGSGLNHFDGELKKRLFDVGIAEEHAVCFAAGLAKEGMLPVFSVYSSFLQRCYDELIHDVAIEGLHVVLAIGNAGIVGEDGETHQGLFDVPFLGTIPNVTVYSPSSFTELELCLNQAIYRDNGLVCVRFPKGADVALNECRCDYEHNRNGSDTLLISYGKEYESVLGAANELKADTLKLVKIMPVNDEVYSIISKYKNVFFFEESSRSGSVGQMLKTHRNDIMHYAVDGFVPSMKICEAKDLYKLTQDRIIEEVRNHI
ncbi:MAG: 1-deoxy-D-xylulose-5-phosphate synthase [Oscillospiraceae bacterium]|nr:1-deoxy-D-xylulose-5-phosphate synthase [Oscillospiraceae bacterium]